MQVTWEMLENAVSSCHDCALCQWRKNTVFGQGDRKAAVMLIGEGPGGQEDEQGIPFVGPAGQLLDKMLAAIGLDRSEVYIANIVKCRPPKNREPSPQEAGACLNYLRWQVKFVHPRIIVCLGRTAGRYIIKPDLRITRERGIWVERKGYHMLPTYHPSALLRDTTGVKKREAWEDMKALRNKMQELGISLKSEET